MVYNLALQYVQNIEDAEEITQDVFVAVYQSLEKFDYQAKISTRIYRIAINKSLDFIKAKNRQKRFGFLHRFQHNEDDKTTFEFPDFDHPGVLLEQQEAVKIIFNAINQLKDSQKTVIILSEIEQKSQKEIAEIMGIREGAVESLLSRAKQKLEQILKLNEGI